MLLLLYVYLIVLGVWQGISHTLSTKKWRKECTADQQRSEF